VSEVGVEMKEPPFVNLFVITVKQLLVFLMEKDFRCGVELLQTVQFEDTGSAAWKFDTKDIKEVLEEWEEGSDKRMSWEGWDLGDSRPQELQQSRSSKENENSSLPDIPPLWRQLKASSTSANPWEGKSRPALVLKRWRKFSRLKSVPLLVES
jgi:hypothetical protein